MSVQLSWILSALTTPQDHFRTLWRHFDLSDSNVCVSIDGAYGFAELLIKSSSRGRALVYIPLQPMDINLCKELESPPSSQLCPYIPLRNELLNDEHSADIVIQFIPEGTTLATSPIESMQALQMIDSLERVCRKVGFSHNRLTAENIIVGTDNRLYPIRYHFATMDGCHDDFETLRAIFRASNMLLCDIESPYTTNDYDCFDSSNGMIRYCDNGLYGFRNSNGVVAIPAKYIWAGDFYENRAIVETAEGCGVIDGCEAIIIPTTIDNLYYDTHNTLFYYYDDDTLCGFDYNGTPIKSDSPLLDHLR